MWNFLPNSIVTAPTVVGYVVSEEDYISFYCKFTVSVILSFNQSINHVYLRKLGPYDSQRQ